MRFFYEPVLLWTERVSNLLFYLFDNQIFMVSFSCREPKTHLYFFVQISMIKDTILLDFSN
ncbi:hypothetical protein ASU31_25160 [Pedobacter ginsenosidimutans]|uniref:Uncharacterized protein n=1 Tax=Pedobacter ginsenosidimutans TaxID=687842 RepID=A0A0T5VHE4_9SPHI|nr:hypothetical protein ASU31_25160 [Pedobacter ginsenosidimutans]